MLVLLHFHDLGYRPLAISMLFLLYEFMGIATNLLGGWVGARTGLHRTLLVGLSLQVVALGLLSLVGSSWSAALSVLFVMVVQALSGVAKDLTKMSSKSAVKLLATTSATDSTGTEEANNRLFGLVAMLTGSKNALKGVGFFVGGALLTEVGYQRALWSLAALLLVALVSALAFVSDDIGKAKEKPPLASILSKSDAINRLSIARLFLFGARDLWFVVALPIFFVEQLHWSFGTVGAFMAAWVIGYGVVQSAAPSVLGWLGLGDDPVRATNIVGFALVAVSGTLAILIQLGVSPAGTLIVGLAVYGAVFALNSSLHSFLILAYSQGDDLAMDVGFYYSANAAGRLVGTVGSGVLVVVGGLTAALWGSSVFLLMSWLLSRRFEPLLPRTQQKS